MEKEFDGEIRNLPAIDKHDEALQGILETQLCRLWNKALVAEKKDYDPDIEIEKSIDQAIRQIRDVGFIHKDSIVLDAGKIAQIIAHYLKINLHTIMGIKRGYYGGCDKELAHEIAQAGIEKLGKE